MWVVTAIVEAISILLIISGVAFFVSGTVGLLRFPDVFARLHALTKCDNLGLGLVALGLALRAPSGWLGVKILAVWALVLMASATAAHLIARKARSSRPGVGIGIRE